MRVRNSEFVAEDGNDSLLSSDEHKGAVGLVKKHGSLVNLTIKDPNSKDGMKYIDLETFEWVAD